MGKSGMTIEYASESTKHAVAATAMTKYLLERQLI
jgi:hypothetical protein